MPDEYSLSTQDPLLGGISPDTQQQVLAMVLAQLASQKQQSDPVADYLAEMKRQDEEQKKQDARRSQNQSMNFPQSGTTRGGGASGIDNTMKAVGAANTLSNMYNGESLVSNIGTLASK
jgi:hypothetical protein